MLRKWQHEVPLLPLFDIWNAQYVISFTFVDFLSFIVCMSMERKAVLSVSYVSPTVKNWFLDHKDFYDITQTHRHLYYMLKSRALLRISKASKRNFLVYNMIIIVKLRFQSFTQILRPKTIKSAKLSTPCKCQKEKSMTNQQNIHWLCHFLTILQEEEK